MEELLDRAPPAYEHLATVDPAIQQELGSRIMQLNHVELVKEIDYGDWKSHTSIPESDHTSEQSHHHDRVSSLITDTAELTSGAAGWLEGQGKTISETSSDHGFSVNEVFKVAKNMAFVEAERARDNGDTEAVKKSVRNILVINLLHPESAESYGMVDEIITSGMSNELLDAVDELDGVIALGRGGDAITAVPQQISKSADLIRITTNKDFDDAFHHQEDLVRPDHPEDSSRREEVLERLESKDLIVLAQLESENNQETAAELATKALEKLATVKWEYINNFRVAVPEYADIITKSTEIVSQSNSNEMAERGRLALSQLRTLRRPGMTGEYRNNLPEAHMLDTLVVELVKRGNLSAASMLMSCSPREISRGDNDTQRTNLDFQISGVINSPQEQQKVKEIIRGIVSDKRNHFKEQLSIEGLDEGLINELMVYGDCPDSALEISSEFWNLFDSDDKKSSAFNNLLRDVISSPEPTQFSIKVAGAIKQLEFLKAAGISPDFSGHLESWIKFSESISDGPRGTSLKSQALVRLKLGIGEDPAQSIRIFSEVVVNQKETSRIRLISEVLIKKLLTSDSVKGFPSAKESKLAETFFDNDLAQIYKELYDIKLTNNPERLDKFRQRFEISDEINEITITDLVFQLKESVGVLYKEDAAAKSWLRDYSGQSIGANKLIAAWNSRSLALRNGIKDNPSDIMEFVAENGASIYAMEAINKGETLITVEELESNKKIASAIGQRYSPQQMLTAVEHKVIFERANGFYPEKKIKEDKAAFDIEGTQYSAEILSVDDPRGFTIGPDTGCCMTLGGPAESCIWAGYEDPNYNFFTVYDNQGKLRAQSVTYLAEIGGERILVVDNIEVNGSTDLSKITKVYRSALEEFINKQQLNISAIHVGVGYTEDLLIKSLPDAEKLPLSPRDGVYSDARRQQKVLWRR